MVAGGDISRQNGRKSKGAKTRRGKEISSKNATKHGLLVKQPPLLITEDLSSFEGLLQGLIDEVVLKLRKLMAMASDRLKQVDIEIAELAKLEADMKELATMTRSLHNSADKLMRYQGSISNEIKGILEQLINIKSVREGDS